MKVKVAKVLEKQNKVSKTTNRTYLLTTFNDEDGKYYKEVYGDLNEGQEVDGEWKKDSYGNDKFEITRQSSGRGGFGAKSDPTSFYLAYSKDIVTAFISAGIIKDPKEAATQWTNFATLGKKLYDDLSAGHNPIKTPEKPTQSQTTYSARYDEPPMPVDINEIDF